MMERILIIEDEPEMLRNLTTILRLEKFRPLSAAGGRLGVDLAKKRKPDLILCDVTMPGLDGYGVIAALRADPETVTIPFIFLTAKAEKFDASAGMNLGADDYITKPVAKVDLLAAIRSRLARAVLGRCECDHGAPPNVVIVPNTAQKIVPNNSRSDSSLRFQNRRW
jgi:DNA-binding response OmpR family regulator